MGAFLQVKYHSFFKYSLALLSFPSKSDLAKPLKKKVDLLAELYEFAIHAPDIQALFGHFLSH